MVRILHTADWQLGLRLNYVPGDAGARLRAERFAVVERIAALAREREVDAVLVAGDVFDDNGVGEDTLQLARDALKGFGEIPVILLPGNHDPATPDSALARLGDCAPGVRLALTAEPIRLHSRQGQPGQQSRQAQQVLLEVLPCPLTRRHERDDPAGWIPARGDDDGTDEAVRVALAHGGALSFGETTESVNRIDVDALLTRGVDYVALGDWHGSFEVNPRAWYAGAPEATRFREQDPGNVLLVEIDGPGAQPRIEKVRVARTRWLREQAHFESDADLDALTARLAALDEPSRTLLRLELSGHLSLRGRARLDALLEDHAQRLAHLRLRGTEVGVQPTAADLAELRADGFVGQAIETLRQGAGAEDGDALVLLHRLLADARAEAGADPAS